MVAPGRHEVNAIRHWMEVKSAILLAADFARRRAVKLIGAEMERKDDMVLRSVGRSVRRHDRWLAIRLLATCQVGISACATGCRRW